MDAAAFADSPVGQLVVIRGHDPRHGEEYEHKAFLPSPLPDMTALQQNTYFAVTEATAAVARLDQAAFRLPNPLLLARPAIRQEAVSTSALEGTYAAFTDVLEADFLDAHDVAPAVLEVVNYVRAAEHAYDWVKVHPISIGMLESLHRILMEGTRGSHPDAGRIRTIQVFIGAAGGRLQDARFVPPPPGDQLRAGFEVWERWINRQHELPLVVKMALGHYQFETLHPFNDGNGRLGRLICVLQLAARQELRVPVLNLSPWLERRRQEYQDHLLHCSMSGNFDPWIRFFSTAVREQAISAVGKIDALLDWKDQTLARLRTARVRGVALTIAEELIGYPMITATSAAKLYGVTYQAANAAIRNLESHGLLVERTGRTYGRVFAARDVLRIIES